MEQYCINLMRSLPIIPGEILSKHKTFIGEFRSIKNNGAGSSASLCLLIAEFVKFRLFRVVTRVWF